MVSGKLQTVRGSLHIGKDCKGKVAKFGKRALFPFEGCRTRPNGRRKRLGEEGGWVQREKYIRPNRGAGDSGRAWEDSDGIIVYGEGKLFMQAFVGGRHSTPFTPVLSVCHGSVSRVNRGKNDYFLLHPFRCVNRVWAGDDS